MCVCWFVRLFVCSYALVLIFARAPCFDKMYVDLSHASLMSTYHIVSLISPLATFKCYTEQDEGRSYEKQSVIVMIEMRRRKHI